VEEGCALAELLTKNKGGEGTVVSEKEDKSKMSEKLKGMGVLL